MDAASFEPIQPGHYPDMPNDEYQGHIEAISKGQKDTMHDSPRAYWARYVDPNRTPEVKTPAQILGDAIHNVILEPDFFYQRFAPEPEDAPRKPSSRQRTAKNPSSESLDAIEWWDDFEAANVGKILLPKKDFAVVAGCRDAAHTHPVAKHLLIGQAEESYFAIDPRTGELVKCRPDLSNLAQGRMIDVKSTEDASPRSFDGSISKFRYDVQQPHYFDVTDAHYGGPAFEHFIFIAIEKAWPFQIGIYWLHPEDVEAGRAEGNEDMDKIIHYRQFGTDREMWPDYGYQPQMLRTRRRKRPLQPFETATS